MVQDTQQLKAEIASKREDLGSTVDAIEDRVSPSRIVQRRKNAISESFSKVADKVMGNIEFVKNAASHTAGDIRDDVNSMEDSVHNIGNATTAQTQGSPLLAGALAAGVGFLASVAFPSTKTEAAAVEQLGNKVQPLLEEGKQEGAEIASAMRAKGIESAQQLKNSATEHAEDVKSSAQDTVNEAKTAAQHKTQEVAEDVKSRKPGS